MFASIVLLAVSASSIANQQYMLSCYERDYVKTNKIIAAYPTFGCNPFIGETIISPKLVEEITASAMSGELLEGQAYKLCPSMTHSIHTGVLKGEALYLNRDYEKKIWKVKLIGSKKQVDAYVRRQVYRIRPNRVYLTIPLLLASTYVIATSK